MFGIYCHGQILKFKDDASCSTKMASKYRVHSIFINKYLTGKHEKISSMIQCAQLCSDAGQTLCLYFVYHLEHQFCLFVNALLHREVISRFIFQKWEFGRVLQPSKRVSYFIYFGFILNALLFHSLYYTKQQKYYISKNFLVIIKKKKFQITSNTVNV